MKYTTYDQQSLSVQLAALHQWDLTEEAIEKEFSFKNFSDALAFIVQLGIEAEKMNHHPEIFNVYNKVKIRLNTHDAKAITSLDFELAKKIDKVYTKFGN